MTYPIGTIASAKELNKKDSNLYIWISCPDCHWERWVNLHSFSKQKQQGLCPKCYMKKQCTNWRGGRTRDNFHGYIFIWVTKNDFFYPMARSGTGNTGAYVFEHRLVMAKYLGRCLQRWEIIHHRNGIKDDNRIENLQLVTDDRHKQITLLENRIKFLETRVTLLEAENVRLKVMEVPLS